MMAYQVYVYGRAVRPVDSFSAADRLVERLQAQGVPPSALRVVLVGTPVGDLAEEGPRG